MSGKRSQRKGKAGELECRRLLEDAGLRVMATGIYQQSGGSLPDLFVRSPVAGIPEVGIEVKRTNVFKMREYLDQLDRQRRARPGIVGAVMMRRDNDRRWVLSTYWDDFQDLASALRAPPV